MFDMGLSQCYKPPIDGMGLKGIYGNSGDSSFLVYKILIHVFTVVWYLKPQESMVISSK